MSAKAVALSGTLVVLSGLTGTVLAQVPSTEAPKPSASTTAPIPSPGIGSETAPPSAVQPFGTGGRRLSDEELRKLLKGASDQPFPLIRPPFLGDSNAGSPPSGLPSGYPFTQPQIEYKMPTYTVPNYKYQPPPKSDSTGENILTVIIGVILTGLGALFRNRNK
jgi:hypothetical protein